MCDQCNDPANHSRFTRRAFLALAAGATGFGLSLLSCQPEAKPRPNKQPLSPSTTTESSTTTTSSESAPATTTTTTESQPAATEAAITTTCPDLGSALFPDPAGNPLLTPAPPVILIPRTNWTLAHPNLKDIRPMNGISRITVHHTAWETTTDAWHPTAEELENIREFHSGQKATDRHWADIAYHFVVDRAGRVWQARPLAYQGAHVKGHNEHNLGIVLLGNFEIQNPTAAQLNSLAAFIKFARTIYQVPLAEVHTHGELGKTSCPGKNLQTYMNRARKKWAAQESAITQAATSTTPPLTSP